MKRMITFSLCAVVLALSNARADLITLTNCAAQNVTSNGALLFSPLLEVPNTPKPYFYWGTTDGGTNEAAWDHAERIIPYWSETGDGWISTNTLTALDSGQKYFYAWERQNMSDVVVAWSAVSNFTTLSSLPTNGPASLVKASSARLNIDVTDCHTASVYSVFYGATDYTNNPALWTYSRQAVFSSAGTQSIDLASLVPGQLYYYRFYDGRRGFWAPASSNFTTVLPTNIPAASVSTLTVDSNAALASVAAATFRAVNGMDNAANETNRSSWSLGQLSAPTNAINFGGQMISNAALTNVTWDGRPITDFLNSTEPFAGDFSNAFAFINGSASMLYVTDGPSYVTNWTASAATNVIVAATNALTITHAGWYDIGYSADIQNVTHGQPSVGYYAKLITNGVTVGVMPTYCPVFITNAVVSPSTRGLFHLPSGTVVRLALECSSGTDIYINIIRATMTINRIK